MFSLKLIKKEDKIKMGKTILKWCLYGSSVLLISCNTTQNVSLEQAIKEISDNQKIILSKIESLEKGQRRKSIEMKAIKVAENQANRKALRTKRIRALSRAKTEKEKNKQSAQMDNAPSEDHWIAVTDPDSGDTYY